MRIQCLGGTGQFPFPGMQRLDGPGLGGKGLFCFSAVKKTIGSLSNEASSLKFATME